MAIAPNYIKVEAWRPEMSLICAKSQGHHYVIMRLESFGVIRHFLTLLTGKTQSLGNQLRAQPTETLESQHRKTILDFSGKMQSM